MLKRFIYLILLISCVSKLEAYTDKRAILVVNKELQSDSFDYNVVTSFLELIYNAIIEEKIVFWDSPLKQARINADNFTNIDQSNNINFLESHNFFIYEVWNSSGKKSSFNIIGFLFSNENKKGQEVNYGYIDFTEVFDILKTSRIKTSVNGDFLTTFYHVFMNKAYNYDLIFFDEKPIIKPNSNKAEREFMKGIKIKNKAFGTNIINMNYTEIIPSKLLKLNINTLNYDLESEKIIDALENYFAKNKNQLNVFGGEQILSTFKESKLLITSVSITMLATIRQNEIYFKLINVTPEVLGKQFYPIPHIAIDTLLILTSDGIDLREVIQNMNYMYEITEINDNKVNTHFTTEYMNAIKQRNFRNLIPKGSKS